MAQDRVEAVERALTVLDVFDSAQESFSLAELAQATGYYKSTLLRLLASLERFNYTERGEDGRWMLGSAPVRLAQRHPPSRDLAVRVQPVLSALARQCGETASLLEVVGDTVSCKLVALPDTSLRHDLATGSHWPLNGDASPAQQLNGGLMICRPLALAGHSVQHSRLWLALSGPSGRLDTEQLAEHLEVMAARLEGEAP